MATYKHKTTHTIHIGRWVFANHIASVPDSECEEFEKLANDLKQGRHIVRLNEEALREVERSIQPSRVNRGVLQSTQSDAKMLRESEVKAETLTNTETEPEKEPVSQPEGETTGVTQEPQKVTPPVKDLNTLKTKN